MHAHTHTPTHSVSLTASAAKTTTAADNQYRVFVTVSPQTLSTTVVIVLKQVLNGLKVLNGDFHHLKKPPL